MIDIFGDTKTMETNIAMIQVILSVVLVIVTAVLAYFTRQYTQATQQSVRISGQMAALMMEENSLKQRQSEMHIEKARVWSHFFEITSRQDTRDIAELSERLTVLSG